uniref:Uncharacterized protein n=1 Tax=Arion vulgaris TaxID=1028688 RepID=A0A0B7ABM1_9EUPU
MTIRMTHHFLMMACVALLARTVTAIDDPTYPCYSNQTRCTSDLRQLLVDTNAFWFGSSYQTSCPGGSQSSPACGNPDTNKKSVLSRLLSLDDISDKDMLNEIVQNISLANITFNAPAGNYTGCGQVYQVPALKDYMIDPLSISRVSSWSLTNIPKVTWNAKSQNTQHVLVIWDPGNFYNHGLYINCENGSLEGGVAVRPFFGPLNAYLRANTYVFAVFEQTRVIDINAAQSFIQGQGTIQPAQFIKAFVSNNSRPVHAGLMTIVADAHSVQRIADRIFIVNNCPYLISQLDTFQTVANATELPVSWSNNSTSMSLNSSAPYLTTLTTSIDVRYYTDDFSVESCCTQYSVTRGSYIVNPFSKDTVRPANVRIKPNVQLTAIDFGSTGGITGETYTLFVVDVAAALLPDAQDPAVVTHWLVTNIKNADVNTGDEVAPYFGPNPFVANDYRPYLFLLMKQPVQQLDNTVFTNICINQTVGCRIHLKSLLDSWKMTEIAGLTFFLAEIDGFARYRIYSVLNAMTKENVCKGLPGYAEPCPSGSACPVPGAAGGKNTGTSVRKDVSLFVLLFLVVNYFITI